MLFSIFGVFTDKPEPKRRSTSGRRDRGQTRCDELTSLFAKDLYGGVRA